MICGMDHSAGTKRKLELVEPQSQSSEVLGSNEGSSYGQEKKPFNGQSDVGAVPSVDMKSILNEDIHVWLKPPSAYKPTDWGWGVPRGYLIAVKPDGLPSVQLKRVELDFRLRFCPGDTGNDVMSLEIENRTKKIQNRYIVKFDGLLNQLPDMGILPVVPVDSVGWKCLLLGEKCQDLTLPLDLYLSDRMLLNPDKLNHGTELISRVSLNMPRLPWARFYQRVLGDPPKVISGRWTWTFCCASMHIKNTPVLDLQACTFWVQSNCGVLLLKYLERSAKEDIGHCIDIIGNRDDHSDSDKKLSVMQHFQEKFLHVSSSRSSSIARFKHKES